jgi:ABC-type antimicrobial peptide transport system permease subunit
MDTVNNWILNNVNWIAWGITVIGVIIAVFSQLLSRFIGRKITLNTTNASPPIKDTKTENELNKKIEEVNELINNFKTGFNSSSIGLEQQQDFNSRLANVEGKLKDIQRRPLELCSLEYQLILFEVERLFQSAKEENKNYYDQIIQTQREFEKSTDQKIDTFKTIFTISITIVGLLIAGFGILIFFIGKGG